MPGVVDGIIGKFTSSKPMITRSTPFELTMKGKQLHDETCDHTLDSDIIVALNDTRGMSAFELADQLRHPVNDVYEAIKGLHKQGYISPTRGN